MVLPYKEFYDHIHKYPTINGIVTCHTFLHTKLKVSFVNYLENNVRFDNYDRILVNQKWSKQNLFQDQAHNKATTSLNLQFLLPFLRRQPILYANRITVVIITLHPYYYYYQYLHSHQDTTRTYHARGRWFLCVRSLFSNRLYSMHDVDSIERGVVDSVLHP
jgi:hypothetical protein